MPTKASERGEERKYTIIENKSEGIFCYRCGVSQKESREGIKCNGWGRNYKRHLFSDKTIRSK